MGMYRIVYKVGEWTLGRYKFFLLVIKIDQSETTKIDQSETTKIDMFNMSLRLNNHK